MTKHYYTISSGGEGSKLYFLNGKQEKEFKKLFTDSTNHEESILWIEKKGNYNKGLENYFASLTIYEKIDDKYGIASSYVNIGEINMQLFKLSDAKKYLNKSLELSKQIKHIHALKESYFNLSLIDSAEGRYLQAYSNYKKYIIYRDSLINENRTKEIIKTAMNYEFDKKEAVARSEHKKELEKQNAISEERSRKQKIILWSVVGGLLLMALFSIFIYRSYLQKQKSNIEILKQKRIIEEKQKEILDSIRYAKRIQDALLPTEKYIDRTLKRLMKK